MDNLMRMDEFIWEFVWVVSGRLAKRFCGLPRGTGRSVAVGQAVDKVSFWRPSAWPWAQKRRAAWPA